MAKKKRRSVGVPASFKRGDFSTTDPAVAKMLRLHPANKSKVPPPKLEIKEVGVNGNLFDITFRRGRTEWSPPKVYTTRWGAEQAKNRLIIMMRDYLRTVGYTVTGSQDDWRDEDLNEAKPKKKSK